MPNHHDWEIRDMQAEEIAELKREIQRLQAALRPFATLATLIECTSDHQYGDEDEWDVKIGLLREARRALEEK